MNGSSATTIRPGSFEEYKPVLNVLRQIAGGNPCLDLGCGEAHVTKEWNCDYVDLILRPTSPAKTLNFDIRDAPERLEKFHYNLVLMSDVIEHLLPLDGSKLINQLWNIASAIVIFTPIGPWKLDALSQDPDAHKSGWTPQEFASWGWTTWAWPNYHVFEGGEVLGAFWAWRFRGRTVTVEEVAGPALVAI